MLLFQGDSGGPLACQNKNKRWIVFGIRTVSLGCNKAAIFASTVKYINWIKEQTAQEGKPFIPRVSHTSESENKPEQRRQNSEKPKIKVLNQVINTPREGRSNLAVAAIVPYEGIHQLAITEPNILVTVDVRESTTLTANPVLIRSNNVRIIGPPEPTIVERALKENRPVPRPSNDNKVEPPAGFHKNTTIKPIVSLTGTGKVKRPNVTDKQSRRKTVTSSVPKRETTDSKAEATAKKIKATQRPDSTLGVTVNTEIPEKIVAKQVPAKSTAVRTPIIRAQEEPGTVGRSRKLNGKRPPQQARNIEEGNTEGQKAENSETLTKSELTFVFGVAIFFLIFMCFLLLIIGIVFLDKY
ncbi:hypothetical protein NDU88_007112 [Pleurodeles waltl]|uniref:Peptidase S1 domain-containing protein n=1 Tax=Pleurodeles waltl TaxID=8319 RepID=A0AAV7RS78_PLEWA|nr:hypothetical protein NDU88_007112 [Pleurodeles waltl]